MPSLYNCYFGAFLVVCLASFGSAYKYLVEKSFSQIQAEAADKFVVFYRSSNPQHTQILDQFEMAASNTKLSHPSFKYHICDGDLTQNNKEYTEAGFSSDIYAFTTYQEQGIQRYSLELEAATIQQHIQYLHSSFDERDVLEYSTFDNFTKLLSSDSRPVFVKFFEQWCTHCKAIRKPFAIAARAFQSKARFLQVECSKNEETQSLCQKFSVSSFPTLRVFHGDESTPFESASRTVIDFGRFIDSLGSTTSTELFVENEITNDQPIKSGTSSTFSKGGPDLGEVHELEERVKNLENVIESLLERIEKLEHGKRPWDR